MHLNHNHILHLEFPNLAISLDDIAGLLLVDLSITPEIVARTKSKNHHGMRHRTTYCPFAIFDSGCK